MKSKKKSDIRKIIVSKDIVLKQLELSDAPEFYEMICEQKEYLQRWWVEVVHSLISNENADQVVFNVVNIANLVPEYTFIILYKDEMVGITGFKNYDENNRKAELGYCISQFHQGKGIVIRSIFALMEFACDTLNVNKLSIKCPVGNLKSSNIPRKLGFIIEGLEHAGEYMNGRGVDLEVYGMLRKEFTEVRDFYFDKMHNFNR